MTGVNRALSAVTEDRILIRKAEGVSCIFLSHQKVDTAPCREIAKYIMKAGLDVYFDEYDSDLKLYRQSNNPNGVTQSIRKGINRSSHMLCVFSPNTLNSKWVPWEIGYGFDKIELGVLTLKDVEEIDIPAYIKTAKVLVRGTKSLNEYLLKITGLSTSLMESMQLMKSYSSPSHPLDDILNWRL